MRRNSLVYGRGEYIAVDGERAPARHARLIGRLENDRTEHTHLGLEQPVRVGRLSALERVGADELRETIGLVRRRAADAAHLVNDDIVSPHGELPGGFAAGESATGDVDGSGGEVAHLSNISVA